MYITTAATTVLGMNGVDWTTMYLWLLCAILNHLISVPRYVMTLPLTFVSALTSFLYISVALIFVTLKSFTENPMLHLDMFIYDLESLVSTSLIFGTSFSITISHVFGLLTHFLIGSNTIPSIPMNLDSDAEHSIFYFAQPGCKLAVTLGGTFLADVHVIVFKEQ
ncbi:hypothetical protein ACJX0J_008901, partial [Zea mays]